MLNQRRRKTVRDVAPTRTPTRVRPACERVRDFDEVDHGFAALDAFREAERCLECTRPHCVEGCPVAVDVPGFIAAVRRGDPHHAYTILRQANSLPAVCGRVCPQEHQCEAACVLGLKKDPVAIGALERYVADLGLASGWDSALAAHAPATGHKVAIIGSGPAGVACAGDLARLGHDVTVFEALHVPGGVLRYGIPSFRLPPSLVEREVGGLGALGVHLALDHVIGKLFTIEQLRDELGFEAIFVGTGAGAPRFLGIPGEGLAGVMSANEFLTRVNLMGARGEGDTPLGLGHAAAVVGCGNTAMDAARVGLRLGARVSVVYRRTRAESTARSAELLHAEEEGVELRWLTNPVRIVGDGRGRVTGLDLERMCLGEPDESGRSRPVPIPGSIHRLEVDTVILALGTAPNPTIAASLPRLAIDRHGCILVDPETQMTSIAGLFAGGDIVTGSATVILAMGAGRRAARAIDAFLARAVPTGTA
ncbi:MAG: NADPH-dependent glutamate synthase [Deltaproteobacteria bacterium]|nr:NADPH-dependent glutamate synthase [Deltaproteobacteria bacterium]